MHFVGKADKTCEWIEISKCFLCGISISYELSVGIFFFNLIYLFIYFWLCWVFVSVRGLSPVVASGGHPSSRCAVRGPLTIAASLAAEHRLQMRRLSNCGSRAQLLHGMWDLPRPGLEPVSPALAGRLSTTAPPGKPLSVGISNTFPHCSQLSPLLQKLEAWKLHSPDFLARGFQFMPCKCKALAKDLIKTREMKSCFGFSGEV